MNYKEIEAKKSINESLREFNFFKHKLIKENLTIKSKQTLIKLNTEGLYLSSISIEKELLKKVCNLL